MSALLDSLLDDGDSSGLRAAAGLGAVRRAARDAVRADGLPGARAEAWKYTNLRTLMPDGAGTITALYVMDWVDDGRWYAYYFTSLPSTLFIVDGATF